MKAITFLEWCNNLKFEPKLSDYETNHLYIRKLQKAMNFYSQPFKPETITDLFEGWFTYQNGYSNHKDEIIIFSDEIRVFVAHKEGTDKFQNNFLFPPTLNDFISDCNRAGIELTFKKEIANKYFEVNNG